MVMVSPEGMTLRNMAIDHAHPALADPVDDLVMPNLGPDQRIGLGLGWSLGPAGGRSPVRPTALGRHRLPRAGHHSRESLEERLGGIRVREQRLEFLPQCAIDCLRREERIALVRRQVAHHLPQRFELRPVVGPCVECACHPRSL
jgi:hypothetical protein